MKRWTFIRAALIIMVVWFGLSGCGTDIGENWKVEITKPLHFKKGEQTTVEIKVTEDGKPVTDISTKVSFEMTEMDHGTVNLMLKETSDGIYTGKAVFPMAGNYSAFFTFKKEGYTIEKLLDVEVTKTEGVATINGEPITQETVDFYQFNNKLQIAVNREADQKTYSGKELEERMSYWDTEEKRATDQNQILTQIIRLRSMALLASEKGHKATKIEVSDALSSLRDKYNKSEVAIGLIEKYGENKFWDAQQKQYEMIVLTEKIQEDVKNQVKKDNPAVGEQEINYLAQKQYEELLVSQVNAMKIEIF